MKIKFLKPHPAFGYFPGQSGEVEDEKAAELIKDKFAEESKEEEESDKGKKADSKEKKEDK
ncbi:hypothetical protein CLV24_11417 [Pontibacter ummariensis]|uniref:Uncharacterized protein n=1 Tax=Pontibacter ummariensis TaxID=1610492 RepID=A0A239HK39_9BACT|nr:hypothetical protein [Pontibacter ummariensis]PRY10289.1 hypothetical protein CLV24_11417 [Pontibacter ummariensis]SNS81501.1 hypothetical protein SAMN06296052_11417 [Pontibacter ummariensis]